MASNFRIAIRRDKDNLYLKLMGDFDGSSAYELLDILKKNCRGAARVFIDTSRLRRVHPFGQAVFQNNLYELNDGPLNFVLMGENAPQIAPRRSKMV